MTTRVALTGNDAVAEALRQIDPDVAAVFPITPQTELMHKFAEFVADGKVSTELVTVESEHSAMSATIGASAAGARACTATSSAGLALMWELLYVASGCRVPIVMIDVNRALSAPINIHCDHSDTMGARDSGWIQIFSEDSQEAYENAIMAYRIAEHKDVLTPVMVTYDGFIISHKTETVDIFDDDKVKKFVGEYKPERYLLDTDNPYTVGPLDLQDFYMEHKRSQIEGIENSRKVILDVGKEFSKEFGARDYNYYETYKMDDAEVAIVCLGSTAGTARVAVDACRENGIKAGLLKIRVFRPFPGKELVEALKGIKMCGVLDRSMSFGLGGPVFHELNAAAYTFGGTAAFKNYLYGLGGRDITVHELVDTYKELDSLKDKAPKDLPMGYIGLREQELVIFLMKKGKQNGY